MKKWIWKYILNIDTIAILLLIIAVLYCFFTTKRKSKKFDFHNLEDVGSVFAFGGKESNLPSSTHHKKKPKKNKHEERCREIFQSIYKKKFKSVRPDWLKNPVTGRNLELDGYCPQIRTPVGQGLAFEYNGIQHSEYKKHFHRSGPEEFIYQTKKDSWKKLQCKQKGVMLIQIPHFVAYEDLERYITNKLDKLRMLPYNRTSNNLYASFPKNDYNYASFFTKWKPEVSEDSGNSGFLHGLYT